APATFAEYLASVDRPGGDHQRFHGLRQPAYIHHNAYAGGARPYEHEQDAIVVDDAVRVAVVDEGEHVYLEAALPDALTGGHVGLVTAADLPPVRFAEADFEEPDGTPLVAGADLVGRAKEPGAVYPVGPLAAPDGDGRTRVW